MGNASRHRPLLALARLCGVQTAYHDVAGQRRQASQDSLLAVLSSLGLPVSRASDAPGALRARRQEAWEWVLDPVAVAWEGEAAWVDLRLPSGYQESVPCRLELEGGPLREWSEGAGGLEPVAAEEVEGRRYVSRRLPLPGPLPWGYHRLSLSVAGREWEAVLVSAPARAYLPTEGPSRLWGVFLPLYALHSRRSLGVGDLSDMAGLYRWASDLGAGLVGTLPLLAAFLDQPFDPSPYSPASRLFWNELYVDARRAPGFPGAGASVAMAELRGLGRSGLVEYRSVAAARRRLFQAAADRFFAGVSGGEGGLKEYARRRPEALDYARFRAAVEQSGEPWPYWPSPQREGALGPGDYREGDVLHHLYAQWVAEAQVRDVVAGAGAGRGLLLDLPLGTHPHGYDVWRYRSAFAGGVSAGAPPDTFFPLGQDWGFPPLHPEGSRRRGHDYLVACLRHHMEAAAALRLDHVMGLHRLFWIPHGAHPQDGVYVRYQAPEQYAIVCLESHRSRCMVMGEDLGTVPPYVRSEMARRGFLRSFVVQNGARTDPSRAVVPPPRECAGSLNTHDMPTFAGFWRGLDVEERLQTGLLDADGAGQARERRRRQRLAVTAFLRRGGLLGASRAGARAVLEGCLALLGRSRARIVMVSLEDLWMETSPQNVPGTGPERANWRRKARHGLEALSRMPRVLGPLRAMARARPAGGETPGGEGSG